MSIAPDNEERLEAQELRESVARQRTALRLISYAHRQQLPAVDLMWMAQSLELDDELDRLAATSPERQQRLAAARLQLLELEQLNRPAEPAEKAELPPRS